MYSTDDSAIGGLTQFWELSTMIPCEPKSPCIMCVQYRGGCSVPWGDIMSTVGGYLEYCGGVQYRGGIS